MSLITWIVKVFLLRPYYYFRSRYVVWRLYNIQGILKWRAHPITLNAAQRHIVNSLKKDGLAMTHIRTIHPDGDALLRDLQAFADEHFKQPYTLKAKQYWKLTWDPEKFPFDIANPCVRLGFHPDVLAIPNSYLDMWTRLSGIVGHKTEIMKEGEVPRQTQKWHRDPDDKKICKLFIYLNDVDEYGGPFTFVKGSQTGGRYEHVAPQGRPYGAVRYEKGRIPEKMVAEAIPRNEIVQCTGPAGTVIFADTTGIHKGGYSTKTARLLILCSYYSRVNLGKVGRRKNMYLYPPDFKAQVALLSPEAQFAATNPLIEIP